MLNAAATSQNDAFQKIAHDYIEQYLQANPEDATERLHWRRTPDYSEADFKAIDAGSAFSLPKLLPEMAATDFTKLTRLGCAVLIFAGRHDYTTPSEPVQRWFDRLQAPSKRWVWFENSAHMIYAEEPGRVLANLIQLALPFATPASNPSPDDRLSKRQ
jgi:pimeloyl-ACP methyl ester carboxylesterase